MSDWGHEAEDLFRSARRGLSPSADDRARVRAKVAAAALGAAATGVVAKAAGATGGAGAGGVASAGVASAGVASAGVASAGVASAGAAGIAGAGASVAAKGLSLALLAKLAVPVVLAAVGLVAVPHVLASRSAPSSVAARAAPVAPVVAARAAPVAIPSSTTTEVGGRVVAPAAPPSPLRANAPAHRVASPIAPAQATAQAPTEAPRAAALANDGEEAALVGAIDAALRSADPAGALRLAAEHQRRFPQGVLAEEREGARVVARCSSGRGPSASNAATAFLAAHPRSPMRARIVAVCGAAEVQ